MSPLQTLADGAIDDHHHRDGPGLHPVPRHHAAPGHSVNADGSHEINVPTLVSAPRPGGLVAAIDAIVGAFQFQCCAVCAAVPERCINCTDVPINFD